MDLDMNMDAKMDNEKALANNGKRSSIDLSRKNRKRRLSEVEDNSITGTMDKKMRHSELNKSIERATRIKRRKEKRRDKRKEHLEAENESKQGIFLQEFSKSGDWLCKWTSIEATDIDIEDIWEKRKDISNDDQRKYIFNDLEDGICAFPTSITIGKKK
ncbi:hypothetical protein RFI_01215 [Reticulomyxa filosa]|uniref:Uncharacterized protein n=1 Tax=Reticulomyxa filosa TaxID=46433 RepID=X6PDV0_RETFI|nr:hypothetical protein RFI_01215 [Reticulomyxa filosa]|eukprot:ETO35847.1 hypothetical protein RFI_01215 [Reticulomyxa filosa]